MANIQSDSIVDKGTVPSSHQCYMITKEIWERGERIEEEILQEAHERFMKKKNVIDNADYKQ